MDQTQNNTGIMNMNFNMFNNPLLNMNNNSMIMNPFNQYNPNMNNLNFNNFNQNMNMNFNQINLEQKNNIEDPLYYINEQKKILKFSNIETGPNKFIEVKIPNSLSKSDLYSIAKKYQKFYNSNILLSYNNYLLKNDETPIAGIPDGSIINIIEDAYYPDDSYYNLLIKNMKMNQKFN